MPCPAVCYYNIPSNNRELQRLACPVTFNQYYNIPSNNRELQPTFQRSRMLKIITYQVITGNYSLPLVILSKWPIITYQVITGNYSCDCVSVHVVGIITYQVITENYTPGLGLTGKAAKSTPFLCNHFAPHFAIKSLGSSPNNPITTQSEPFGFS